MRELVVPFWGDLDEGRGTVVLDKWPVRFA
jgi:hypothetical protein